MKNASIYWYSQTGNSYACARAALAALSHNQISTSIHSILKSSEKLFAGDLIIFVFPVFNFNVPYPMRTWLTKLEKQIQMKNAVAIITHGGMPANTPYILKKLLKPKNIDLKNYLLIHSEDSYIPVRKYLKFMIKKNSPDETAFQIIENFIQENVVPVPKQKKCPYRRFNPFHWIGQKSPPDAPKHLLGKRIFSENLCTDCGFCYKLCSVGAITYEGKQLTFNNDLCIGCCGCLNICPRNAWKTSRFDGNYFYKGMHIEDMVKEISKKNRFH